MLRRVFLPLQAVMLGCVACHADTTVYIGDGYTRAPDDSFVAAVQPLIESDDLRILPWSVSTPRVLTIQLNTVEATRFADDLDVAAVVGHAGSRDALLAAVVYNARGVPNVVPNATSRKLRSAGPWTFPLAPDDSVEGEFLARYALDSLQKTRVAMLYVGDEYGVGLRDGVRAHLRIRGMDLVDASVVPNQPCLTPDDLDLHRTIVGAAVRRARPDVVIVAASIGSAWCLTNLLHAIEPDMWVLGADGMDGNAGVATDYPHVKPHRLRIVRLWTPGTDPDNQAFIAAVRQALGRDPNASEALQYDAFRVLAAAVRDVGNDRRAIRQWLASLGDSRPAWPGVTGPISFASPRSSILRMTAPGSD